MEKIALHISKNVEMFVLASVGWGIAILIICLSFRLVKGSVAKKGVQCIGFLGLYFLFVRGLFDIWDLTIPLIAFTILMIIPLFEKKRD